MPCHDFARCQARSCGGMGAGVTRASPTTFSPQPDFVTGRKKKKTGLTAPAGGGPEPPPAAGRGSWASPLPLPLGGPGTSTMVGSEGALQSCKKGNAAIRQRSLRDLFLSLLFWRVGGRIRGKWDSKTADSCNCAINSRPVCIPPLV